MRLAVRPAHAAADRSRREVSPLHVAEILVVESVGQGAAVILEGVDRAVLGVEQGAEVADLAERVADQPAGGQRRRDRVERKVDRALLVEMHRGEIEQGWRKIGSRSHGFQISSGPNTETVCRCARPWQPPLQLAQKRADIFDEIRENAGPVLALHRMHLVPQIPGEDDAAAAPAAGGEGEPRLDQRPRLRAGQEPRAVGAGAAIVAVVGVLGPVVPDEERVERGQQQVETMALAKRDQIVPQPDHFRPEHARRTFEMAHAILAIFEHQPETGHAVRAQPDKVTLHGGQVAPADQAR